MSDSGWAHDGMARPFPKNAFRSPEVSGFHHFPPLNQGDESAASAP